MGSGLAPSCRSVTETGQVGKGFGASVLCRRGRTSGTVFVGCNDSEAPALCNGRCRHITAMPPGLGVGQGAPQVLKTLRTRSPHSAPCPEIGTVRACV